MSDAHDDETVENGDTGSDDPEVENDDAVLTDGGDGDEGRDDASNGDGEKAGDDASNCDGKGTGDDASNRDGEGAGDDASNRDGEGAGDDVDTPTPEEEEEMNRRRLIKWVVVIAFSIPVVIELLTFGELFRKYFGGEEETETETQTESETEADDAVGEGEELVPETEPSEIIERSVVQGATDRTYLLRVAVENTTDDTVELELGTLTVYDGQTVAGRSSTGTIQPGESGEVTGAWELPNGEMPETVAVREYSGDTEIAARAVSLKRPPIEG
jgi:hypothetical protein